MLTSVDLAGDARFDGLEFSLNSKRSSPLVKLVDARLGTKRSLEAKVTNGKALINKHNIKGGDDISDQLSSSKSVLQQQQFTGLSLGSPET